MLRLPRQVEALEIAVKEGSATEAAAGGGSRGVARARTLSGALAEPDSPATPAGTGAPLSEWRRGSKTVLGTEASAAAEVGAAVPLLQRPVPQLKPLGLGRRSSTGLLLGAAMAAAGEDSVAADDVLFVPSPRTPRAVLAEAKARDARINASAAAPSGAFELVDSPC